MFLSCGVIHAASAKKCGRGIANAVSGLHQFQAVEAERIQMLQTRELTEDQANSILLRSAEAGIVGWRLLPKVLSEWRRPRHESFVPRTAYSLLNCFTEASEPR